MGPNRRFEVRCSVLACISHSGHEDFDDGVEFADVDKAVAVGARHLRVHLRHHGMRVLGGGKRGVYANAEAAVAVRVGRRHLDEGDVNGHLAALEQRLDLTQEDRGIVGAAVVDGFADVAADEQGVVTEVAGHLGRAIRRRSQSQQVHDFDVVQRGARVPSGPRPALRVRRSRGGYTRAFLTPRRKRLRARSSVCCGIDQSTTWARSSFYTVTVSDLTG